MNTHINNTSRRRASPTIGIDARLYGQGLGLGRYVSKLIEHLEQCEDDYQFVIFLRKQNFDAYIPRNQRFRKVCVDIPWYSLSEQLLLPWLFFRERCDLLHVPHFNIPILYPNKILITIHDLILVKHPLSATIAASTRHPLVHRIKYWGFRAVLNIALARACRIIAVSQAVADDLLVFAPDIRYKLSVVHEAADVLPSSAPAAQLSSYEGRRFFFYAGNAYPHKNLGKLLGAIQRVHAVDSSLILLLCGQEDFFQKKLVETIVASGVRDTIKHLGCVSDSSLRWLYEHAIAIVLPSREEGFGLQIVEAGLHGCPVICSDIPVYREVGGNSVRYVDTMQESLLAEAMLELAHNERSRNDLILKEKMQVQRFSWHRTAQKTQQCYYQCL